MHFFRKNIKSILILILLSGIFALLWSPKMLVDKNKGYVSLRWSGLSALFNDGDFGWRTSYYEETFFDGPDGPYVYYDQNGFNVYRVSEKNIFYKEIRQKGEPLSVRVPNADHDSFSVELQETALPSAPRYPMPSKLLVLSDIEGNFNGFYSFLLSNQVIDKNYNWTYGNGHLVLLGDFVDRGHEVTQVLWLIYKLEASAREHGGMVHYILGNHELMNIQGHAGYADRKYVKAAQEISGSLEWDKAYKILYSDGSVLGNWLRSKNAIEMIGDHLFVHGGLSPDLSTFSPTIEKINSTIRQNFDSLAEQDPFAVFLLGKNGPLWHRCMASDHKDQKKLSSSAFDSVLKLMHAGKIVIGHTLGPDIETDYNGKLIRIDVLHGREKGSGATKGLLIENGISFKVDDTGKRIQL